MLREELRRRIKALKTIIPDDVGVRSGVVVDLRDDATIDLTDSRDEDKRWIHDERVVDFAAVVAPRTHSVRGLGAIPPAAADVFWTLDHNDREMAHLVAAGFDDAEIATALDLSPNAVRIAIRALLLLTGFETRPEMMIGWHTG